MNNWTWDRLRVFDAVARTGSVTAAARSLRMTGPAVSQHLRRLESEVGRTLVERAGRGLRLTHEGTVLAEHSRTVAEAVAMAERELADSDGELHGTLRIGAISSAIRGFLLERLRVFTGRHPGVRVHLCDGETADHLAALRENGLDVVIAESWHDRPAPLPHGAHVVRLHTEQAALVVPIEHRLADRGTVTFGDLAAETWTCCPAGSDGYRALAQLAHRAGTNWEVAYPTADHTTQLEIVASGLAIACIPERSLPRHPAKVRVLGIDPPPRRDLELIAHPGTLPRHISEFITAMVG